MLPHKDPTGLVHGIDIERPADVVKELSIEGTRRRSVHNAVSVLPAYRMTSDIESRVDLVGSTGRYVLRQMMVQGADPGLQRQRLAGLETGYLSPGMNPCISATGHSHAVCITSESEQRALDLPLNSRGIRLVLRPVVSGAIIFHNQGNSGRRPCVPNATLPKAASTSPAL